VQEAAQGGMQRVGGWAGLRPGGRGGGRRALQGAGRGDSTAC
jgi:hypothetical protein